MAEKSIKQRWLAFHRWQRWSIITSFLLLLYTILGFFILPAIVRSQLEKKLTEALHRQTTVAEVKINPFTLQCAVNGFQILDLDNEAVFVGFDSLQVNVQSASLFKLAVIVKSISLINPLVNVALHDDLSWNFTDLLVSSNDKEEGVQEDESKPLLFSLNNIQISGGVIRFDDQVEQMAHEVIDLRLDIPYVSALPSDIEIFIKPAFQAVVNGTPIGMKGGSKPFHASRQSEFDIKFTDIDLTKYLTYLPDDLGFTVHSGLLDLTLAFNFMQHDDGKPAVKIQGRVGLRDVDIRDRNDLPILSFPEMLVDIDQAYIVRKEFHLARFSVSNPVLSVERLENGEINWATLFPASSEKEQAASPTGNALLLNLEEAVVDGATVHFSDRTVPGSFQTTLQALNIQVDNFSTAYESMAEFLLSFASERGENVTVDGVFSSLPLRVNAEVNVTGIQLDKYRPYYQGALAAALQADKADVRAKIEFAPERHLFMITDAGLDVGNLSLVGERVEEKIVIPSFAIKGIIVDVTEQKVFVSQCSSRGGVIPLVRRQDGSLNVQDFLAQAGSEDPESDPQEEVDAGGSWIFVAKNVDFADYSSIFTDQVPGNSVQFVFDTFNFTAANITNGEDEKGRVDLGFRLNETATVKVGGSVGLLPLSVALDLGVQGLPFKAAQPYMDGKVNAIIGSGTGGLNGSLTLAQHDDDDYAVNFHGNVDSQKLSVLDSQTDKVLSWDSLLIRELDVATLPMRVSMGAIVVDGVESFMSMNKDGQLNLASLTVQDEGSNQEGSQEEKSESSEETKALVIEIGQVELLNSRLDFVDQQVSPPFITSVEDIQGQIKGLSSSKDVFADIDISAKLGSHSPMTISGKIHPWEDFFTDLTVGVHDVELGAMSPYTLKFIGYPLTKGKLSLDLHYLVEGKKLTSKNKAFIDQITLGDYVENDTASNLPVQLAISLLKNRAGEIKLDIPVSGELDDPEFSVAGVVFTVIKNLLVKAATSPFALLGSLFPENQDFLFMEFAPGVTEMLGRDDEKWDAFATAMYDHPALKLEVTGFVDPEKDRAAMILNNFDHQLKIQKLKDLIKQKQISGDVDAIVIHPEEYEKYLKKAYKEATFKRPRNFLGLLKGLPPAEMEKLIYDHIVISDDDLHKLGMDRATVVKDFLVEAGPIEPERIFLLQPQKSQPDEDVPALRVEIVAR